MLLHLLSTPPGTGQQRAGQLKAIRVVKKPARNNCAILALDMLDMQKLLYVLLCPHGLVLATVCPLVLTKRL